MSLDLQKIIITQALDIFQSLEVSSYKESLELLKSFSLYSPLLVFKELKLLNLYRCQFPTCSTLTINKANIKRHFNQEHKDSIITPLYIVVKGHSLEANRFFFEIQSREFLNP